MRDKLQNMMANEYRNRANKKTVKSVFDFNEGMLYCALRAKVITEDEYFDLAVFNTELYARYWRFEYDV